VSLLTQHGWTPRTWQNEALDATRAALIDPAGPMWQSGIVVAATGTGKSVFIAGLVVAHALKGGRVVVVVDREGLVIDLFKSIYAVAKDHGFVDRLGPRVGMSMAGRNELEQPIVVASIQSLSQEGRLAAMGCTTLLITDEAHGATSPSHRALHARLTELFHHPDGSPRWKHVGMTATPFRGDGSEGLGDVFDGEIYCHGIKEAIEAGDLVPIDAIHVPTEVNIESASVGEDGEVLETEVEDLINNDDRNALAWEHYLERAKGKPALFFALNIKHAYALAEMGRTKYGINALPVHGGTKAFPLTKGECNRRIALYKQHPEQLPVLVSCDLIRVGFDAPETYAVVLCRPWNSLVAYMQTIGRGTRTVGVPAGLTDPAERRAAIARSRKPKMVFIQLVDVGCRISLDPNTNLDSTETAEADKLQIGDKVQRRRHAEWGTGAISGVASETGRLGRELEVVWPLSAVHPAGAVRVHPERDLKRPPKEKKAEDTPKPEPAVVSVTGRTPYQIFRNLLPGQAADAPDVIDWYEYQGTYTVSGTASRVGRVLMHIRHGAKGWELWSLRAPIAAKGEDTSIEWLATLRRPDCATPRIAMAEGDSHLRANGAIVVPISTDRTDEDASTGQKGLARRWGVKRDLDGVTAGECSALISAASAKRTVDEHLDPGLAGRRKYAQQKYRASA